MNQRKFISLMSAIEKLKCNTRHSWTSSNRHESVAEHSFRLALMAYFVKDEFTDMDINKVILMCLCHDLGEAITGDIPAFLKKEEDEKAEYALITEFIEKLPEPYNNELLELFEEMNELNTKEAKLYKALDKMEAVIQHNEADISTWIPLEYELNLSYGKEAVEFSSYLVKLKEELNKDSIKKIENVKKLNDIL